MQLILIKHPSSIRRLDRIQVRGLDNGTWLLVQSPDGTKLRAGASQEDPREAAVRQSIVAHLRDLGVPDERAATLDWESLCDCATRASRASAA